MCGGWHQRLSQMVCPGVSNGCHRRISGGKLRPCLHRHESGVSQGRSLGGRAPSRKGIGPGVKKFTPDFRRSVFGVGDRHLLVSLYARQINKDRLGTGVVAQIGGSSVMTGSAQKLRLPHMVLNRMYTGMVHTALEARLHLWAARKGCVHSSAPSFSDSTSCRTRVITNAHPLTCWMAVVGHPALMQILHVAMRKARDEDHAIRRIFRDVNLTLKRCPPRKSVVFAFDGR